MWIVRDNSIAMRYTWTYRTPDGLDDLVMSGYGESLTGLRFKGSRDDVACGEYGDERDLPVFRETCRWLDEYFAGRSPDWTPTYHMEGLTEFRKDVIDEMLKIPFGTTASYGDIAKSIAKRRGVNRVSAQAVGGAVGWNPICIIIPCHRVIGASGKMVGYGGGVANKVALLAHEMRRTMRRMGAEDFRVDAVTAAKRLVGAFLCRRMDDGTVVRLRITETEAYCGEEDTACHAHKGRTPRTDVMYSAGGCAYIYLCYGMHEMLNVVTGPAGHPEAVLVRGIDGAEGPGRLTKALQIDRSLNREDLVVSDRLWLETDDRTCRFTAAPRIGIAYASKRDQARKWRFTTCLLAT